MHNSHLYKLAFFANRVNAYKKTQKWCYQKHMYLIVNNLFCNIREWTSYLSLVRCTVYSFFEAEVNITACNGTREGNVSLSLCPKNVCLVLQKMCFPMKTYVKYCRRKNFFCRTTIVESLFGTTFAKKRAHLQLRKKITLLKNMQLIDYKNSRSWTFSNNEY